MVGFGEKIAAEAYQPWAESYLSYGQLKLQIEQILVVRRGADGGGSAGVYEARKHIFQVLEDAGCMHLGTLYHRVSDRAVRRGRRKRRCRVRSPQSPE